jgi:hypothetical protein
MVSPKVAETFKGHGYFIRKALKRDKGEIHIPVASGQEALVAMNDFPCERILIDNRTSVVLRAIGRGEFQCCSDRICAVVDAIPSRESNVRQHYPLRIQPSNGAW